jgi:hypothetical protein
MTGTLFTCCGEVENGACGTLAADAAVIKMAKFVAQCITVVIMMMMVVVVVVVVGSL